MSDIPSAIITLASIVPCRSYPSDFDLERAVSEALTKLGWTDISFVVERRYDRKRKRNVATGFVSIYRFQPTSPPSYLTERFNATYEYGEESASYNLALAQGTVF